MKNTSTENCLCGRWLLNLLTFSLAATVVSGAEGDTNAVAGKYDLQGKATLRFDIHAYTRGFRDGEPEFLTRYSPLRSYDGDDFPGYFVDLTELKLDWVDSESGRPIFGLERSSLAYFNQKNSAYFNPEPLRLDLRYSLYRSQQIKADNRVDPATQTPGTVANSIFAVFNDDSFGRTDFYVQRSDFGAELKLRPDAFGLDGTQLGDIDLSYDRSDRDSVRFFDYVLTRRLAGGDKFHQVRWRGIDQRVIEDVNRGGLALSATPFQWITVSYEFSAETYDRRFDDSTLDEVARIANVPITPDSAAARNSGPLTFIDRHGTESWPVEQVTLGWVPSTTKLINKIKFDKKIGPASLNFGYANVFLDQDEFTDFAKDRGLDRGQIITHSAFGNWTMPLSRAINWNAHTVYRLRDNRFTFPALDPQQRNVDAFGRSVFDYMNPLLDGGKHGSVFAPFLDQIETFKFGTDFTFALPVAYSRIVAGWEREDTSRDLIFGDPPPGQVRSIDPNESFIHPDSVNDTLFVNYSARPLKNLRLRLNNSFILGDEVGLVSEPETGVKSRIGLSYFMPDALKGATVDLFYQLRYADNDDFTVTSIDPATGLLLSSGTQEREQFFQSAGLTFTIMPSEPCSAYTGYIWNRDSLEANFMKTSARRYDPTWLFTTINSSRYLTDAHTVFVGSSYQFSKRWFGNLDYSVTWINGDLGSGEIETVLGADNELDNVTHHIVTGLNYQLRANASIGARYAYAVYDDNVNPSLNGGYHSIGVLASLTF